MKLRVWAPGCREIAVRIDGEDRPMQPNDGGWWEHDAGAGVEYSFFVDGEGPFPDPRSPSQPYGVHGVSRLVDHRAYAWRDRDWVPPPLHSAVIYELHIGTFTAAGTFGAAIERLDDLADLGVTHVEIMPVHEFSGSRGWGYDGVSLFAPHHAYGTPDELKRLVDACHERRLAVLLDVVYNHLGPSGNYLGKYGPYFTDHYRTPWGDAVNFDGAGSAEVRRFFCDNALMWLRDYHFDGLRLDAVHAIVDTSAIHFLEQLQLEVEQLEADLGRSLVLIAESDANDPRLLWPRAQGGYQLAAQWSDDFHHALHAVLSGERQSYYSDFGTLADVAKALRQAFVYDGRYSAHRQRLHGRSPRGLSGHRFLGYMQNHDQVGNRGRGERSSHLMSLGRVKIGAALALMSPFIPLLFQGEEWAATTPFLYFTAHEDAQLAQQVRDGRRAELSKLHWAPEEIPDPKAIETFERSRLQWAERERAPHNEILLWYRNLIELRGQIPALTDGRLDAVQVRFDEAARWLVLERGPISVVCNLNTQAQQIDLGGSTGQLRLASDPNIRCSGTSVHVPPDTVAIIES